MPSRQTPSRKLISICGCSPDSEGSTGGGYYALGIFYTLKCVTHDIEWSVHSA